MHIRILLPEINSSRALFMFLKRENVKKEAIYDSQPYSTIR